MPFVFDFLDNLALLTLMGVGVFLIETSRVRLGKLQAQFLYGLVFGAAAFLVTATPLELMDGATVDARAGPVVLAGVVGGPIAGLLAAFLGALSRGLIGGSFAISGVVVYFVYGLIGVALAKLRIVRVETVSQPRTILILSISSFCGAAAMFVLIQPVGRAIAWLAADLPLIIAANFISVAYGAAIVGVVLHFTRKTSEIFELNKRLELAKSAGRFGIWDYDIKSDELSWDARSAELHGLSPEEMDGSYADWARNVHEDDLSTTEEAFRRALAGQDEFSTEYRVKLPENDERTIKGDAIVLRDYTGNPVRVVGTNLDLTLLRAAEARRDEAQAIAMRAQKFDTIGKLTGGVAHDFNNLLAVIMGNQELLRDALELYGPKKAGELDLVDATLQAARRGAELTQSLLAYARQASLTPEPIDLNRVVRETETWLRRTIESRIQIECVLQAGLWSTFADRASLQSALVNLLVNARDALDGPGKVTVETANVRIDADHMGERAENILPGRYVMLAVSDTGPGMPPEIVDKIFDPFFTTKPVGKGAGLGLSMVQGFVKQSGGAIRVYSEPGVGTSFKLYFPASSNNREVDVASEQEDSEVLPHGHSGKRILLVEDRMDLLPVLEKTLRSAGYQVVSATSGDEAFRVFRADGRFDLVATDIVMPGALQGPSLAKEIRELCPDMPFIFFSGYARQASIHGNGLRPDDISLMKPVSRRDLLAAVEETLSAPSSGTD